MMTSALRGSAAAGHRLREIFSKGKCVAAPGAFNGLVARAARDRKFETLYISGAAVTASAGVPDIGVLGLEHFSRVIKEVSRASDLPIIADCDTGFGEEEMVRHTVHEYAHSGAGALHFEDQVFPKRCGHLDGKELVSIERFSGKIERAREAAESTGTGIIVCARTDGRAVEGFDGAVKRAEAYVRAGAEMVFPESLCTRDEFRKFAEAMKKLPGPAPGGGPFMLANMTEFGKTEHISVAEFEQLGYNVVIFPVTTLRCAMKGVTEVLDLIEAEGSPAKMLNRMFTRKELYEALRYTPGVEYVYPGRQ